jgi:hypothetical protein
MFIVESYYRIYSAKVQLLKHKSQSRQMQTVCITIGIVLSLYEYPNSFLCTQYPRLTYCLELPTATDYLRSVNFQVYYLGLK